ncbi:TonB-dependent receptor [Geomonas silvestris]|uniref:TonB-dependent receptor n=1 Tax=Geomonas silvestris TaxID=2740184 RepID=A0A6V8MKU1_9BACT|nr:TonB-dependent receptor [Geomonas silvestris]GFO60497.1 TonB-dependent receptor [Geomonas silvestris]
MKQKPLLSTLAILNLLPLLGSPAFAAQPEDSTSDRYNLGEIVVSAPGEGVQATETVRMVTAKDIETSGARTLDEAIALLPGVNIRNGGEGVPRIDIRGFKTRHVVLLLDGIPLNSAFDQQFDPTAISTENIAEIKMTSGASSILYGQGGLGGVINIITKKGMQRTQGMVGVETGDHEPYQAKASVSGASDRFNYFFSGNAQKVDGFPLSDDFRPTVEQGSGYRKNSDHERNSLLGTVGFTPNQDLALGLTVNYAQGSYGKPATAINDSADLFANTTKFQRVQDYSTLSLQLAGEYAATQHLNLRGWTWFTQHDELQNQYGSRDYAAVNLQQKAISTITGVTLQPKYDFGPAGSLALSLSAENDAWDTYTIIGTADTEHPEQQIYSAGIEYEFSPLPGLNLVAGYGHYWQARSEVTLDDYSALFGASYDLTAATRLKASFKRNVRFPSLGDLYDTFNNGNPQLLPERSHTYEAGVDQKLPLETTAALTGFYTTVENLVQTNQDVGRKVNLAEVRFAGAELSVANRAVKNLLLRGSYSYLHSEDRSRAGREEQQYTPEHVIVLEGKYDCACGFTPYASVRYVGNQYAYTKNNVQPVQKAKLNDYTLVNLKLNQQVWGGKANLYVGADNLFDQNYETSYGFPQPGRFVYGGVEFRL